jgi:hypothetical protein
MDLQLLYGRLIYPFVDLQAGVRYEQQLSWDNGLGRGFAVLGVQRLAGRLSKNIATDLGISQRTVENHRASIMKKTGSRSLPALTRLAFFAAGNGADGLLLLGGLSVLVLQRRVHS